MDTTTIKINNFNLADFSKLLSQSLSVNQQVMMEIDKGLLKSCSFSSTKTFMKLWTIPLDQLIIVDDTQMDMFKAKVIPELQKLTFNFYILKGDLFRKYLSVHDQNSVDVEFTIVDVEGKSQASVIKIIGKSESGTPLTTTFQLTTEDLILNKVADYDEILRALTPSKDMVEIFFSNNQISETKGLIKKLHKSSSDNSRFVTFKITNKQIRISDRVFEIDFPVNKEMLEKNAIAGLVIQDDDEIDFNILKNDFIITGDHTFNFFTSHSSEKVIIIGKYGKALVSCLTTKVTENSESFDNSADDSIGDLDLAEYGFEKLEM
jgi:hypothetical protein